MADGERERNSEHGSTDRRWALPDGVNLLWKYWSDEVVVLNTSSGQTHLLDSLSAAVLGEIERGPGSARDLAERLGRSHDLDADATLVERIAKVCAEFETLGLADRIEPCGAGPCPTGSLRPEP